MEHGIITISRQYGSGGRLIGAKLAEELHIPFYDRELIALAAQSSPIHGNFFEHAEENGTGGVSYPLNPGVPFELPLHDKVFLAQSAVIRRVAAKGPCVIVGRCADDVLKEETNLLKLFIFAGLEIRTNRVLRVYEESEEKIEQKILSIDKKRSAYYQHYTQKKWGKAENYHLCLDSGRLEIDGAVEAIAAAARSCFSSLRSTAP